VPDCGKLGSGVITRFAEVYVWTFGSYYWDGWKIGELVLQLKYMLEHVVISVTIKLALCLVIWLPARVPMTSNT